MVLIYANIEDLYGKTQHICSIYFLWDGVIVLKVTGSFGLCDLALVLNNPLSLDRKTTNFHSCFPQATPSVLSIYSQYATGYLFIFFWLLFLHYLIKKWILIFISVCTCCACLFSLLKIGDTSMFDTGYVLIFLNNSFSYLYKNEIQAIDREAFKGLVSLEQL